MKCDECSELLTTLSFGELSEGQELTVHEHLADCDSCREVYIELVETKAQLESAILGESSEKALSAEQKNKIMTATISSGVTKAPFVIPSWVFALAACLVIALLVGVSMDSGSPDMVKTEKSKIADSPEPSAEAMDEEKVSMSEEKEVFKSKENLEFKDEIAEDSVAPKVMKLEAVKEELKKAESKKQLIRSSVKAKKAAPAAAPQMLSDRAVGFSVPGNVKLNVPALREMLGAVSKDLSKLKSLLDLKKELAPLKDNQIQLVYLPIEKGAKTPAEKILIRILNNGQKAIDYAHIFVHNQTIIRVERVK